MRFTCWPDLAAPRCSQDTFISMAQTFKVRNLSRGLHWKFRRAEKAVCECACAWVEYGVTVRDLTLQESIAARNVQAATREPLDYAEIPGIIFSGKTDYSLIRAAHQFCAESVA